METTTSAGHWRILVTGASGFIGAHAIDYLSNNTIHEVVGIDSFCHKGTYSRLDEIPGIDGRLCMGEVQIFHHNLTAPIDPVLFHKMHSQHFDVILNFASNSAVERSMSDPGECWHNNCHLVYNMLEFAREIPNLKAFVQISTDEVYGDYGGKEEGFVEWDAINPSNPYAASKAAQEALCIAYWRSYDLPIVIANTMNNIGEWQDAEKFVPRVIAQIHQGKKVYVYTDNEGNIGSRIYLDVKDHIRFLMEIIQHRSPARFSSGNFDRPDRWNVVGIEEFTNLEMAELIAELMGQPLNYEFTPAKSARPGYDKRYLLNGDKLYDLLKSRGSQRHTPIMHSLQRIIKHTLSKPHWIEIDL